MSRLYLLLCASALIAGCGDPCEEYTRLLVDCEAQSVSCTVEDEEPARSGWLPCRSGSGPTYWYSAARIRGAKCASLRIRTSRDW